MISRENLSRLLSEKHGVVSRIGKNGESRSAVVGFTATPLGDNGFEIIIGTEKQSRKVQDITANDRVSFVIFKEEERRTLQVEGTAKLVEPMDLGDYRQMVIDKNPAVAKIIDAPSRVYIVIYPSWIKYTDVSVYPWHQEEESVN